MESSFKKYQVVLLFTLQLKITVVNNPVNLGKFHTRSVCWLKLGGADRTSATGHVLFGEPRAREDTQEGRKHSTGLLIFTFCLLASVFYTIRVSLL